MVSLLPAGNPRALISGQAFRGAEASAPLPWVGRWPRGLPALEAGPRLPRRNLFSLLQGQCMDCPWGLPRLGPWSGPLPGHHRPAEQPPGPPLGATGSHKPLKIGPGGPANCGPVPRGQGQCWCEARNPHPLPCNHTGVRGGASGTTESPHQASAKRPLQKLQREMLATGPLESETGRKGKKEPHTP